VSIKRAIIVVWALIWSVTLLVACGSTQRLRLKTGEVEVQAPHQIVAGEVDRYILGAKAAETLSIHLVSPTGNVYLSVEGKDGVALVHSASRAPAWTGITPASQDYVIQVAGDGQDAEYMLVATRTDCDAKGQEPYTRFGGIYHMKAPVANALHDLTLFLSAEHSAVLTGLSGAQSLVPFVMEGTWQVAGEIATIELTSQDQEPFALPEIFQLQWRDGLLTVKEHGDGSWRTSGLRFAPALGDCNAMVRELHRRLAKAGYLLYEKPGPGDDAFTDQTRLALMAFQEAQGLESHGVADAATWAALDIALLPERTAAGAPILYLTFDDGPDGTYTPQILEMLERYDAQATFFVLGEQAQFFPDLIRAEAQAGHYVANHGYAHHAFDDMSRDELYREIQKTERLLREAAGDLFAWDGDVHFVRPPYGLTDESTQEHAGEFGYVVVMWDVDSQDWQLPGATQIAWNVLNYVQPGDIVLMHDGGGDRSQTVLALEMILQELRAAGYEFHSLFGN
jgi:peptidoglycan/xylan/chitin deacetylase (PgdA/CDA1 family)